MSKVYVKDLEVGMFFKLPLGSVLQVTQNEYIASNGTVEFACKDYIGNERNYTFQNTTAMFIGAEMAESFPEHLVQNLKEYRERNEKIPSELQLFRKMVELNQKKMAEQFGMSATTYSKIERGEVKASESFKNKFMQLYPEANQERFFG